MIDLSETISEELGLEMVEAAKSLLFKMHNENLSWSKELIWNLIDSEEYRTALYNSMLSYELCVMKKYAMPLLTKIERDSEYFPVAERLMRLLKALKEKHDKTIIIVTHDVDMLYEIVDNIIVLNKGNIVKTGSKIEVFKNVELLDENNTPVPNIIRVEKMIYDKTGVDLGVCNNINSLVTKISEVFNYEK